jgi:hypothetical protein
MLAKAVEQAMFARFGEGPVEGEMKALIITATKPQQLSGSCPLVTTDPSS